MYSCVCVCVCQSHASFSSVKQRELFLMKKMNKFACKIFSSCMKKIKERRSREEKK